MTYQTPYQTQVKNPEPGKYEVVVTGPSALAGMPDTFTGFGTSPVEAAQNLLEAILCEADMTDEDLKFGHIKQDRYFTEAHHLNRMGQCVADLLISLEDPDRLRPGASQE